MYCSKPILIVALIFFCIPCHTLLYGQTNFNFERITNKEGLAHNQVRAITQDEKGFIWIGTTNGLQRYDGNKLVTFKNEPNKANSIGNNIIRALHADKNGSVWIGTRGGGLSNYNNGKFTSFTANKDNDNTISDNSIECFAEDKDGNLWIGTRQGGVNKLSNGVFTSYQHDNDNPNSISHNAVFSLLVDSKNRVWLGTYGGGLNLYENGRFRRFKKEENNPNSICSNFIVSLMEGPDGEIWIGSWQGGFSIFKDGVFKNYAVGDNGLNNNSVLSMIQSHGQVWLGTWGGGINYLDGGHFESFSNTLGDPKSLGSNFVECFFKDRKGFLWIGTFGGGVNRFSEHHFTTFKHIPFKKSINNNFVNDVLEEEDGSLWIGTLGGGLNHYKDGEFTYYTHDPNKGNTLSDVSNTVWALEKAGNKGLWVATENGLNLLRDGSFTPFNLESDGRKNSNIIYSMAQSKTHGLLLGTWEGDVWRVSGDKAEILYDNLSNVRVNANYPVYGMAETEDGTIWIASAEGGGLIRWKDGAVQERYFANSGGGTVPEVYAVEVGLDGKNIWVGTNFGFYRYNIEENDFRLFSEKDGLVSNPVMAIEKDGQGYLWISTLGGLSRFDPVKEVFHNFNELDGLQGDQFNRNASFTCFRSGLVYFGGTDGFTVFHPDSVSASLSIPDVVLTKLEISYQEVKPVDSTILTKSIENTKEIVLSHQDDIFSIEYTALNNDKLGERNQFAFYLDGYENQWNYVGDRTFATYSNIPPGDYRFLVKASSESGDWNNAPTVLNIIILPPWWQTWWARFLLVFVIAGSAFAYYYYRINTIKRRNKELEKVVDDRTGELQEANSALQQANILLAEKNEEVGKQKEEIGNQAIQLLETNAKLEDRNHQLLGLVEEKNLLIGVVAHDLKTPLSQIVSFVELAKMSDGGVSEEVSGYLADILGASGRLINMITRILETNALDNEDLHLAIKSVDINSVCQDMMNEFEPIAEKKDIVIRTGVQKDKLLVKADKDLLHQVFENLISNAIKFSPPERQVNLEVSETADNVCVKVSDEGPGITPEDQKKLFNKYQKLTAKPTGEETSTGLGLFIVKKYIKALKGKIWCESQLGKGTSFIVELDKA